VQQRKLAPPVREPERLVVKTRNPPVNNATSASAVRFER
jgi:hypothetical protein